MKTTASLLTTSALAAALVLAQPVFAGEEQRDKDEAQSYARELLEPEEQRDGLSNIRDEREEERLEEEDEEYLEEDMEMEIEEED